MTRQIVVLSGRVASGKTTLGDDLGRRFGAVRFKTNELIRTYYPAVSDRKALQLAGDRLDRRTKGAWVADAMVRELDRLPDESLVVVDAVRRLAQVEALRTAFGRTVVHVHLTAPITVLEARYKRRQKERRGELRSYDEVRANATEAQVEGLARHADVVIDSSSNTPEDVLVRVGTKLGLYGTASHQVVDVVIGGQFGSEGKGHIVSYLAPEYELLIRVGGPNAGHTVRQSGGGTYVHHQLPSGALTNPAARLAIGPGAVLRIEKLLDEIRECEIGPERLSIDPQAITISQHDIDEEERLESQIGSTRQGVGAATARRIMGRSEPAALARDAEELAPFIRPIADVLNAAYSDSSRILLEGTQGLGLSIYHGFYPYVTSRDTGAAACLSEAGIAPGRVRRIVMVVRTFPIRVANPKGGTSGPMSQEIDWDVVAAEAGLDAAELWAKEKTSTTHRDRRVGRFDWQLLRTASLLNGPTDIALTFADYLSHKNALARRFDQLTPQTVRFVQEVEDVAAAPVSLISTRFHERGIIDRRLW